MTTASIIINASDKTGAAFASVKSGLDSITGKVGLAVTAITGLAGVGGFGALVASSLKSADILAKTSDSIGIATEKLAAFQHLGELTGVSQETMNKSLQKMTKNLGDASFGAGAAAKTLQDLNLNAATLAQLSPDQQYRILADAIGNLDSRTQQASAATAIFGRNGIDLLNTIDAGSEGFKQAEEYTKLYGLALSRVDTAKIEAANDEITKLQGVVKGAGNSFAVELAPYVKSAGEEILKMAKEAGGFRVIAADAIDGVINGLGFLADGVHSLEFAWQGMQTLFAGVAKFILGGLDDLQKGVVDVVNVIPGVDIKPIEELSFAAEAADDRFVRLKSELDKIAFEPMPSEQFKKWAEEVKSKANEVGKAVADAKNGGSGTGTDLGAVNINPGQDAAAQKEQQQMQTKLEQLQQSLMSEQEVLQAAYEQKQFLLEDSFQNELISSQEKDALMQQLAAQHQAKLTMIQEKGLSDRDKFERKTTYEKTKFVLGQLGDMLSGVANQNKTLFKINKIAGIANAIISTSEGVTKSLAAYPYPWNIGMAAATFAAGIAQVNSIRSQQFGGGGSAPSPSAGGGGTSGVPSGAASAVTAAQDALAQAQAAKDQQTATTAPAAPVGEIKVNFGGENRMLTISQARQIYQEIEEARRDMGPNTRLVF